MNVYVILYVFQCVQMLKFVLFLSHHHIQPVMGLVNSNFILLLEFYISFTERAVVVVIVW
jgi:hypothetical protein